MVNFSILSSFLMRSNSNNEIAVDKAYDSDDILSDDESDDVKDISSISYFSTILCDKVVKDNRDKSWKIGSKIGSGGTGKLYLASDKTSEQVNENANYVIKLEPYSSGPLFVEVHFYSNVGKKQMIDKWVTEKKYKVFGMPQYYGHGCYSLNNHMYRFLVLERFSRDLQTIIDENGGVLNVEMAFSFASNIIDVLEYVHHNGYVHADIKASNLMLKGGEPSPVYLLDFGLACKYIDSAGRHKRFECDSRKEHNGTLEFTSRDAHCGANSRRGDLEILAYNLIKWISGSLPWEDFTNYEQVAAAKFTAMNDLRSFIDQCFCGCNLDPPDMLTDYLSYVKTLKFSSQPDYHYIRALFRNASEVTSRSLTKQRLLSPNNKRHKRKRNSSNMENQPRRCKVRRNSALLASANVGESQSLDLLNNAYSRLTRKSTFPILNFDWPKILAGHPERPTSNTCMNYMCEVPEASKSLCDAFIRAELESDKENGELAEEEWEYTLTKLPPNANSVMMEVWNRICQSREAELKENISATSSKNHSSSIEDEQSIAKSNERKNLKNLKNGLNGTAKNASKKARNNSPPRDKERECVVKSKERKNMKNMKNGANGIVKDASEKAKNDSSPVEEGRRIAKSKKRKSVKNLKNCVNGTVKETSEKARNNLAVNKKGRSMPKLKSKECKNVKKIKNSWNGKVEDEDEVASKKARKQSAKKRKNDCRLTSPSRSRKPTDFYGFYVPNDVLSNKVLSPKKKPQESRRDDEANIRDVEIANEVKSPLKETEYMRTNPLEKLRKTAKKIISRNMITKKLKSHRKKIIESQRRNPKKLNSRLADSNGCYTLRKR